MKLNLLEHLDWHDVAFVNELKNHQLINLDHLLDVLHKPDTPKLHIINYKLLLTQHYNNRKVNSLFTINCIIH